MAFKTSKLVYDLNKRVKDLSTPMRVISNDMLTQVNLRFRRAKDPDGDKWPSLKHRRGKPLNDRGILKTSFRRRHNKHSAIVGTKTKYAPTHQFGASQGQYGKTKRNTPIPWGDVPKRPFLGINKQERKRYKNMILKYLKKGSFRGGDNLNV